MKNLLKKSIRALASALPYFGLALAALLIFTSLAEHLFFNKIVDQGVSAVLDKGFTKDVMGFALPLVANGTISFLSFPVKAVLAISGVLLAYISAWKLLHARSQQVAIRNIFSRDYWLKFSLVRYEKTQVKK